MLRKKDRLIDEDKREDCYGRNKYCMSVSNTTVSQFRNSYFPPTSHCNRNFLGVLIKV